MLASEYAHIIELKIIIIVAISNIRFPPRTVYLTRLCFPLQVNGESAPPPAESFELSNLRQQILEILKNRGGRAAKRGGARKNGRGKRDRTGCAGVSRRSATMNGNHFFGIYQN